jgi:hypothetical protein
MTEQELTEATATLQQLDTEIAACRQGEQESIDQARKWNDSRRTHTAKRSELERVAGALRERVAAVVRQLKIEQIAKAKAEAEAKEQERAAAKAAEQSELEKARAEIAALKAQLQPKDV